MTLNSARPCAVLIRAARAAGPPPSEEPHDRQENRPDQSRPGRQAGKGRRRRETKKPAKAAAKAAGRRRRGAAKGKGRAAKGKAAKPGKADDKAAKPEASDVDLSDLEADLEGEPVVEADARQGQAAADEGRRAPRSAR